MNSKIPIKIDSTMPVQKRKLDKIETNTPKKNTRQKLNNKIDKDNSLWTEFNKLKKHNLQNDWVSPSNIKNWLMNDAILDWIKLYLLKEGSIQYTSLTSNQIKTISDSIKKEEENLQILFDAGLNFENNIFEDLNKKYESNTARVSYSRDDITIENSHVTEKYMLQGIPIIQQAVLFNTLNHTFGVADLLIRSDWINDIFSDDIIESTNSKLAAPLLNGNYHYLVIDIKWTTMYFCVKKEDELCHKIRNNGYFPAYKGQLAIYNAAVGVIQGYTPPCTYIMAKHWVVEQSVDSEKIKNEGFDCYDTLGCINYSDKFDNGYIDLTINAIEWARNLRQNGNNWTVYPPSVPELYPNMCNTNDSPYHNIKVEIGKKLNELTELWMVGPKNRKIGHENGIFKWTDENCTAANIGINGKINGPILDKIININRPTSTCMISPEKGCIENNTEDWQTRTPLDFYIDFETINECFTNIETNIHDSRTTNGLIFMIGVGFEIDAVWNYVPFYISELSIENEKQIISNFVAFIQNKVDQYNRKLAVKNKNKKKLKPRLFHWSHAEKSFFSASNKRHDYIWSKWFNSVTLIDFCAVCRSEPIVVKGAKNFSLKSFGKSMFNNKMIQTKWCDDGVGGGLEAMFEAIRYYQTPAINRNADMEKMFENIVLYNEIDCKVMWEIIEYVRARC